MARPKKKKKEGENPLLSKVDGAGNGSPGAWAGCQDPGRRRGREGRRLGCQRPTTKGQVPIPGRSLGLARLALGLNDNLTFGVIYVYGRSKFGHFLVMNGICKPCQIL